MSATRMTAMIRMKVQDVKKSPIRTFLSNDKVQETYTRPGCKNFRHTAESRQPRLLIRGPFRSCSNLCRGPMQDFRCPKMPISAEDGASLPEPH